MSDNPKADKSSVNQSDKGQVTATSDKPHVNIYIGSGIMGPGTRTGKVGYVLEFRTAKGPVTVTDIKTLENSTEHHSALTALVAALKRLTKPCNLTIHLDTGIIAATLSNNWIAKWKASGWQTSRNEEVSNRDLWQLIDSLTADHDYTVLLKKPHEYRRWLTHEMKES